LAITKDSVVDVPFTSHGILSVHENSHVEVLPNVLVFIFINKPVGDRDHEVLGMGSFWEYAQLPTTSYKG
jgi:hypothetical protein